ncbi:MAG: hypothetical protein VX949_11070 [Planctomycetota bacterium]|nr:hypothetical protein [Planctomycetota bacterium]
MPKVSIRLLRVGLLLFNVAALTLLGFVFFGLLDDSPQGTQVRLFNPVDFELKEQAARPVPNQYRDIIRDLYLVAPPVRTAPVKPTTDPVLPQLDSGPIGDWDIVGVIYSPEGQRFASIQEKGQTSVINSATRGRTINTSRVRGSSRGSTRGSSRSPTSRASSRSPGRTQISNQRVRYLEQGKSFRIDENTYMVVDIQDQPKQVIYEHNGRSYTLRQESKIDPVIHEEGNVLVLRGFSPEELDLLTGGSLAPPGASKSASIPTDVRGAIRGSDGKELPGTAASRARGAPPPGAVRTPAAGATPNPNVRTRRGDIRDPRAERTGRKPAPAAPTMKSGAGAKSPGARVTRTTIESTLGVDIEANPQEAIRRLEELNRAQQPNQPDQR